MAVREVRGVMPGLLAQENPTIDVYKSVEPSDLGVQGKISPSGLVTVPISYGYIGTTVADPTVSPVDVPQGTQTKEIAKLTASAGAAQPFPWLLLALAVGAVTLL